MTQKRAYISVADKENIEILAKNLIDKKYEIISTGNTHKYLKEKGINVIESSTITGFNELLGGKVKSLHPTIFAGILANEQERLDKEIKSFDLVAVDLYPFENYMDKNVETETLILNIDIGGVALLRAAAKNYENVIVISDKKDYSIDLDEIDEDKRQKLALKAFSKTSKYDYLINKKLSKQFKYEQENKAFYFEKLQNLRYGENPHQMAGLYSFDKELDWELLNGKEMSYNNILDSTSALEIAAEFFDVACCTIIKHTTPCAVALSSNIETAWDKALDSDPISPFGGVVAFTQEVNLSLAKKLSAMFLEVILAPSYSIEALEELKKKKNLRIIKINTPYETILKFSEEEIKLTPFGALIQQKDTKDLDVSTFKVVTKKKPEQRELEDMIFAFKVVKHVKSNAIVIAKDLRTIGICGGQTSRVSSVEIALNKVCDSPKGSILASDGFFPAIDNIQIAAQNRVSAIIQPAGSIKDKEVIETADKYEISMISTGIRHFKH
ncbi:MAG: bifunctional phosphoribosylaminoimidazolecarboxamide formyltransferase/IMP cyclohydrolase [Candidatus Gastranaerophilales bacterium]|nr:bifunctional phosphoribosylaminoimidazolecarboxamide formyltransferase/IMP cyclohydrolase [Candidatus Gastranaerophilales bacterium]